MNKAQQDYYISALSEVPKYRKYMHFHWADYIELLCLANISGEISVADLEDRLFERKDLAENTMYSESLIGYNRSINSKAEVDDAFNTNINAWFDILESRSVMYGEAYPFVASNRELKKKKGKVTLRQKTYIYLLLCSNLFLQHKQISEMLTSSFEILSFKVIKNILPKDAEVHIFGTSSQNKKGRYGAGMTLWEKLNLLANDLHLHLHPDMAEEQYPSNNRGDDGLDIVGWINTGDLISSRVVFLGQCACSSNEWKKKQSEASFSAWENKILFVNRPTSIILIPFCFRRTDGTWFKQADIHKTALIDRSRILYYLRNDSSFISKIDALNLVDEVLKLTEDVI